MVEMKQWKKYSHKIKPIKITTNFSFHCTNHILNAIATTAASVDLFIYEAHI